MPPVPPLPWGNYEVYSEAGVNKWLGPQPVQMESMHDGGDPHGFWNSRRGAVQQVPDPEAERVQRLEQELKDLREALTMRQVQSQDPLGAYGAQPFQRMGPPNANPAMALVEHEPHICQDVNMRDWIHVNSGAGQPNLQHRGNQTAANLCGGHPGQPSGIPPSQPGSLAFTGIPHDDRHREGELKLVTMTLPKLPDLGGKNPGLEAGDCLAQIRPQIADISARAMQWLDNLLDLTMQKYQQWLGSDPITHLNVQPPTVAELPPGFTRLEQRVTSLLLQTLPKSLASEMVANRPLGAAQNHLQGPQDVPAGWFGRQNTLQALTATQTASSYADASASLRLWKRHYAGELGATLPDPTLMTGALDKIMSKLLQTNPQATFRLNAFRMHAKVDSSPLIDTVQQLHEMLLAEVELGLGSGDQSTKSPGTPAIKALQDKLVLPRNPNLCVGSGSPRGDANMELFVASNILLMTMASTTAIPVGQLRTISRAVHMLLRPRMARDDWSSRFSSRGGVDPVVVEKALLVRAMEKKVLKAKVEKCQQR